MNVLSSKKVVSNNLVYSFQTKVIEVIEEYEYPREGMASKTLLHQLMVKDSKGMKRWGFRPRGKFPVPDRFKLLDPENATVASLKSG